MTMDNELLSVKIAAMEAESPRPEEGRGDEPDGPAFHVSLLWPGAGLARVECPARRRYRLSRERHRLRLPSPRSDRPSSGC